MFAMQSRGAIRPRMVLGFADSTYAAQCGRFFRRHGWEVHLAADGAEIQRQVESFRPAVLVLDAAFIGDGTVASWCAWLGPHPELKVILFAAERSAAMLRLQESLHARALCTRQDALQGLGEAVLDKHFA